MTWARESPRTPAHAALAAAHERMTDENGLWPYVYDGNAFAMEDALAESTGLTRGRVTRMLDDMHITRGSKYR